MTANVTPFSPSSGSGEGVRSVLSLRSEEEKEVLSLPPPQREEGATLASTLLALGVFILAPAKLRATASALAGAGVEPQQLIDLAQFIAEAEDDAGKQRKYLASVLVDTARTKEALANVAKHKAARVVQAAGSEHVFNLPWGSEACRCNACVAKRSEAAAKAVSFDRACAVAWFRVDRDKAPRGLVADENGVSMERLEEMLKRGQEMAEPPRSVPKGEMKKAQREEEAAQERMRRFRESPRSERLRLLKGDA